MPDDQSRQSFFVSYAAANRSWAEWISWQLEDAGHTAILQAWDFRPGENFVQRMAESLEASDRTIALVSQAYLTSRYCLDEWTGAFLDDEDGRRRLVLVQIEDCVIPRLLRTTVHVELDLQDATRARAQLLEGLRLGRAKPDSEPPFPGKPAATPRFPGARPRIFNLQPRNPQFTGRRDLLDTLREQLNGNDSSILIQAVHGLAGIGKTQLALEYAHRFMVDYAAIWWIIADRPATITTQLAELATKLGVPDGPPDEFLDNLFAELGRRGNWLLIFDNAEDPSDLDGLVRPEGHTIITSRNPNWREVGATPVELNVLEQFESVAFMAKRSPRVTTPDAERLADLLDGLPLALAQAAAFIDESQISGETYRRLLVAQTVDMLDRNRPPHYPQSLASTWTLSLDRIKGESLSADAVMSLCAFLAPDRIPREHLPKAGPFLPKAWRAVLADPLGFTESVALLRRFSLINATEQELSVHRLMQEVVRHRTAEEDELTLVAGLVRWLREEFHPIASGRDTESASPQVLLPHVLATVEHAERLGTERAATITLLDGAGQYLHQQAQLVQALGAYRRAFAVARGEEIPGSVGFAEMRSHLGAVLHDLGQNDEARVEYAAALASYEATYGPHDIRVAEALNALGRLLQEDGDLRGAHARLSRALSIAEAALEPNDPTISRIVGNLGRVTQDLGDMQKARAEYERALEITIAAYGEDDPRTALRRNNLAGALQYLGRLQAAQQQLVQALAVLDATYGSDHPRTVATRANYAAVLHDLGDLAGARDAFTQALAVLDRNKEANRPRIADACAGLGTVLTYLGEIDEAIKYHERALSLEESTLGIEHPRTATICVHCGISALRAGESGRAVEHFSRALATNKRIYGTHHPRVATIRSNLGIALQNVGDLDRARVAQLRALVDTEEAYGPDHPRIAAICTNLARVMLARGEVAEALKQGERALDVGERSRPPGHPRVEVLRSNLDRLRSASSGGSSEVELEPMPIILRTYQQASVVDG